MPVPLAVVELPSARLSPNPALADLLGLDEGGDEVVQLASLVSLEEWPIVERVLDGVASGAIESCQTRGKLRLPSGGTVEVVAWIRPLEESRPCEHALLAMVAADGTQPSPEPWLARVDVKHVAFGALDHDWRFTEITPDAAELLGWHVGDYLGSPIQRAVHPDDVPLLLLTLGRSGCERRAVATRLRVRGPGNDWTPVRCALSPLCDHVPPRFGFALWLLPVSEDDTTAERTASLETHLWRIAAEVQAAGVTEVGSWRGAWWKHPALRAVTQRQADVLRLVVSGKRIPEIAAALFVSQSTVRNHLSAIYRKVGVGSQSELLARLIIDDVTAEATDV